MKSVKIILCLLLTVCLLPIGVFADEIIPQEIIADVTDDNIRVMQKVYVLPKGSDGSAIPTESFSENSVEYVFDELKSDENFSQAFKEYTENVSYHTPRDDVAAVVALFSPTLDVTCEDGYSGTLSFDYTTLKVAPTEYNSQKVSVSEERIYPNLASADTSLVPKTIDKDGLELSLASIEWLHVTDSNNTAVRYTAKVVYTGAETRTYVNGYIAAADYSGTVYKNNDTVTYTAVFKENKLQSIPEITEPESEQKMPTVMMASIGIAATVLLFAVGYIVYRIIRRKREGY